MNATTISWIRKEAWRWAASETLPREVIELLYREGLFKLFLPARFGGKEYSLAQAAVLYTDLAAADGSLAWLVQIGAGGGYFVPSLMPEVAERIFAPREAVIAGSGYPTGVARKVAGGYRVTGSWKYASGAQYATTFTANAQLEHGGSVRAFAFDRGQVELFPSWNAIGMRATSSWSFSVNDVFVPDQRSFLIGEKVWNPGLSVYNVPFILFAIASFGAVAVGLARTFFEEAIEILSTKRPSEHIRFLSTCREYVFEAEDAFFQLVNHIEPVSVDTNDVQQEVRMEGRSDTHNSTHTDATHDSLLRIIACIYDRVWAALPWCGMHVVHENNRSSRILRDMLVLRQHELLRSAFVEVPGVEPGSGAPVV